MFLKNSELGKFWFHLEKMSGFCRSYLVCIQQGYFEGVQDIE